MAVDKTKLAIIGYAPYGRKVYAYYTNDNSAAILTNGYFDAVYPYILLEEGDLILASIDEDGTAYSHLYLVTVGGADVTVKIGPIATALQFGVGHRVGGTGTIVGATIEAALAEFFTHVQSTQKYIPLPIFCWQGTAGVALAAFSNGASAVPGYCVTAKGYGIRWNNHTSHGNIIQPITLPANFNEAADIVLHILAAKIGIVDAPTFTVTAFNNVVGALYDADSTYGVTSTALVADLPTKTVQHVTSTMLTANLGAYPQVTQLTIAPTDTTMTADDIIVLGTWLEYKGKTLTS